MSMAKMMVMGRLGADPDTRQLPSGSTMLRFRMATSEKHKQPDGSYGETTQWHQLVAYSPVAERLGPYLRKGMMVYVEGPLRSNKWTTRDGVERLDWQVVVQRLEFCERRGAHQAGQDYPPPAKAEMYQGQPPAKKQSDVQAMGYEGADPDEIPF